MQLWRPPGMAALAWLTATALGVGAAWVGLRPVLDAAVPDRTAPLSAANVRHLAVPSPVLVPAPIPSRSAQAGQAQPPASSTPSASTGRSSTGPTSSARTSPTVIDGWTVTTQADGTVSYLRSFQVKGGSTVIRMTPGRVYLVSATPNPEYTVSPEQNEPTRLVVRFTTTGRYDLVDAIWWNDRPYAQVSQIG